MAKELLFRIRINIQQEKELERINRRINELIVLKKKNNGLTVKEGIELKSLRKDYNGLTNQIIKQNQVRKGEINTLGRINSELAVQRQRIKNVVLGSKEFDKVAARIKNLENKQRQANAAMGRGTTFVGEYAKGAIQAFQKIAGVVMATVIALRTLSRVFKGIIDTLVEFEQGQMNVQTLLEDFDDQLRDESIILIRKYGLTINDTNRALFDAVSAGVSARESFKFMNEAAILAVAGISDLESVVDGMTTVMNVWGVSMEDMDKVSAAFFTAQKKGKFYIADITAEIGKVAAVAKIAGLSYQELMTTYAALTKRGLPLELSTTAIKATILAVAKPSQQAADAFREMGIETGLTAVRTQGLFTILTKINEATRIQKDKLTELIPNVRALTGVAILNEEALIEWHEILKLVNEDIGEGSSIMKAYELQMGTLAKKQELLTASWQALVLSSREGNAIGRIWGKTLDLLAGSIGKLTEMSEYFALITDETAWRAITAIREQENATGILLLTQEELEEQIEELRIRSQEYDKYMKENEEIRKARAELEIKREEERKERIEARIQAEKQAFDELMKRIKDEGDAKRAMEEEDQIAADEAWVNMILQWAIEDQAAADRQAEKDEIDEKIAADLDEGYQKQLKKDQKRWKSEIEQFKKLQDKYKQTVGIFTDLGNQLAQMTNEAITQGELNLKKFAKISIAVALDTLQKIILLQRAEILAKALATPDSIATFGAAGLIRFAIINTLITTAFQAAKAIVTANKGMIVPGQGNKDTVSAILTPKEGIINARSMTSPDVMTLTGTPYQIASQINSYKGYGIPFAAGGVAPSVTNNTFNNIDEASMDRIVSGLNERRIILNINEVTEAQQEIQIINETSEL